MKRGRQILIAVVGVAVIGVAVSEHLARRRMERRYQASVEVRAKLEVHIAEVLTAHERLKEDFRSEQEQSRILSESLTVTRWELEDVEVRLAGESRNVRKLQQRFTTLQRQMDQLQGELVLALQEGGLPASEKTDAGPVELERIVVSTESASMFRGRVVSVHPDWDFVVINLGWDAVRIGDTVSIIRDEELLAKVRVDRIQAGVSAATILPEWESATIHINDIAQLL